MRDNYAVGEDKLLILTTDRLSAFDVIMQEPIPDKGKVLNQMALYWFEALGDIVPNHLTGIAPEVVVSKEDMAQVAGRSMVVKRLQPIMVEAVVRGYLIGSGWKDYQDSGAVCGIKLPAGLRQADRLSSPIFTPTTKAPKGQHDEPINDAQGAAAIGAKLYGQVKALSLTLYQFGHDRAKKAGMILADTKFEFGTDAAGNLFLIDEVLTPDSSRYWPAESYVEGANPPSYDKQFLRDWLEAVRINGKPWDKTPPAPRLPRDVVDKTAAKYQEALTRLTA